MKNNGGVNYYAQPVHSDQAHIVALDEVLGLGMVWGYVSERLPKRVAKKPIQNVDSKSRSGRIGDAKIGMTSG